MDIIAGHVNPDFDCLASMVAAHKLYPEAKMVYVGSQNRNVREFYSLHGDVLDFIELRSLERDEVTRVIMVDTRIADRLGELAELVRRRGVGVFTFDHHPPTGEDVRATRDFSRETGATTTIMVDLIRAKQLPLTVFEATLFALGIHEDTGSLTYPTTTPEDAEALAYLMAMGANIDVIDHFLSRGLITDQQSQILEEFVKTARHVDIRGVDVVICEAQATDYVDGVAMLPHRLATMLGVEVVFALIQMRDRVQLIGRSKAAEVDVGAVLAAFEGGGHAQAASASVKRAKMADIQSKLEAELEAHVGKPIVAREIMSAPVRTIQSRTKISEANKLMARYAYDGLPVVEKGNLAGIISRRDVDKAVHHGLAHAPVKGFMSRKVVTIAGDMSLHEIHALLSDESIGRLPVVQDGKIAGIVTRTDLLRALHGSEYLGGAAGATAAPGRFDPEHVRGLLEKLLPANVRHVLTALGELAAAGDVRAYLVGGAVRDLLLGVTNLDIDIVVEGDGIAFAKQVVKTLGGRVRAHRKFGTAVVVLPDDFYIDVASARTEFYERPGALPEVERSSIRLDLARRDFSINAMALALDTPRRGTLLDFFAGPRDLTHKTVKVLHSLSFVEDPTRIFRAVRFEQRYGFRMDEQTEELARRAIEMGLVIELSNVRVREELIAILSEETAFAALNRLSGLGALAGVHPKVRLDEESRSIFVGVEKAMVALDLYFTAQPRKWVVLLMATLRDLKRSELVRWGERMRLRGSDVALLEQGIVECPKILRNLRSTRRMRNSRVYFLLHGLRQEALLFAFASATEDIQRRRIVHYLTELKGVKPHLTGRDLVRLGLGPGPHFGEILKNLQVAKLDGRLSSKDDEEAFLLDEIESRKTAS